MLFRFFASFISILLCFGCASNATPEVDSEKSSVAAEQEAVDTARVTVWDVDVNPEAVAIGPGVIYATHFGKELAPMKQDGDGYIGVYDANGQFISKLVTGLDAPKGMEVFGNQLFVADVDSLLGFSTQDGTRTFSASFTGEAQFLNGLATDDQGSLYVSATDAGKIWRVDIATNDISLLATIPHVNGLVLSSDKSVLYAVQYNGQDPTAGRLLAVNPNDGSSLPLGSYTGMLDGVAEYKGAVYFTDWNPSGNGKVLRYDQASRETTVVLEDSRLQGPADFEVLGDGLALIPMLTGSRILGVRLD